MRKLLIPLLLASAAAATPALADPGDHQSRDEARSERQQARAERQESRAERPQFNGERGVNRGMAAGQQGFARDGGYQQSTHPNPASDEARMQAFRAERQRMRTEQTNRDGFDERARNWQMRQQQQQGFGGRYQADESLRQSDRAVPNVMRRHDRSPLVGEIPRQGTQPPLRYDNRRREQVAWNTNWRRDGRYDWRGWRDRHRSVFHLGYYYDPFGWGYQPFSIGWRLWPNYYSANYWINDPWQYRLPFAPPGTRWVRYYDDALLVDMFTGQVVDVIRDFFW